MLDVIMRRATVWRNALGLGLCATAVVCLASGADAAVVISEKPTKNMSCANGTCTATAMDAVLNVTDLKRFMRHSLTIWTGTVSDDIVFSVRFDWSKDSTLTLVANHSVRIDKPMSVEGDGGLSILANQAASGGSFGFSKDGSASFWSPSGRLKVNNNDYMLASNLSDLIADIQSNPSGNFALAASYDAAGDGTYTNSPIRFLDGRFEGLGNRISNLTIDDKMTGDFVGLFRLISFSATAENIVLTNAHVTAIAGSTGTVAGDNQGSLARSYASGTVTGPSSGGGLVGANVGSLTQSAAAVVVAADYAGGLVGDNDGTISNSFATGAVNATGSDTPIGGGLVGREQNGSITASYSIGAVTGDVSAALGGSLGENFATGNSSIYWDTDTSGQSAGCGIGNCSGVTGQTTAQLQAGLPLGFDSSIWAEKRKINGGFPFLLTLTTSP